MDFLKSGLKTVLGSPEPGEQPSGAETVSKNIYLLSVVLPSAKNAIRLCHLGHDIQKKKKKSIFNAPQFYRLND